MAKSLAFCKIDFVVNMIGNHGAVLILHQLMAGPKRTTELLEHLNLSSKTLSDRLKELERFGLIAKLAYREAPPRVEYHLTDAGLKLKPVLDAIEQVAAELSELSNKQAAKSRSAKQRKQQCPSCRPAEPPPVAKAIEPIERKIPQRPRNDIVIL